MHVLHRLRERKTRRTLSELRRQFLAAPDPPRCKAREVSALDAKDFQTAGLWPSRLIASNAIEHDDFIETHLAADTRSDRGVVGHRHRTSARPKHRRALPEG